MKNAILFVVAAIVVFPIAGAGQSTEQIEMQTLRLREKLSLNKEQTSQVREIFKLYIDGTGKEESQQRKSRRERIRESLQQMDRIDLEIEKILTKEQKKKFEEYKEERRNEMRERMKERQL